MTTYKSKRNSETAPRRTPTEGKPTANTGTIRNNLERYRSDDVSDVKARQAASSKNAAAARRAASEKALKRKRTRKLIIRLAILLVVILICAACFLFTYRVFYDVPLDETNTSKVEVVIPNKDISDEEVADMLLEAGCIDDTRLYKLRTYIYDANYVPGTYSISPSFSTEKIINILSGYDYSNGTMEE